ILILMSFISLCTFGQNTDSVNSQDSTGLANYINIDNNELLPGINMIASDTLLTKVGNEYNVFAFKHRIKVYKWQLVSAKIIFVISIIIVLVGLYMSYLHFRISTKVSLSSDDSSQVNNKSNNNTSESPTSFQFGKDGIKIQSTVIGLIILVISIVYFLMYLKYIYPIKDIGF
ncbi:MAG: hypothetical protein MI922_09445, partial [Bacteroidales bacterium]|nr:hypothetical protein [Bacteroidales bacterium]